MESKSTGESLLIYISQVCKIVIGSKNNIWDQHDDQLVFSNVYLRVCILPAILWEWCHYNIIFPGQQRITRGVPGHAWRRWPVQSTASGNQGIVYEISSYYLYLFVSLCNLMCQREEFEIMKLTFYFPNIDIYKYELYLFSVQSPSRLSITS